MSQIYSTEPQTSGQVVFETTHGPLSIHLWCKECPSTTRYFLQLCIDGYYDNLVFHRIVPNFLIQTGDAQYRQDGGSNNNTATDNNNNDPYRQPPPQAYRQQHQSLQAYERRKYELNSRIRFNHRGQVAMALPIDAADDDNNNNDDEIPRLQPQFFITLGEASHLDGKHVCFGGVTGPTVFNALRIGQTDVYDEDEGEGDGDGASGAEPYQPRFLNEAPRILRTKVLAVDLPPTVPPLIPTVEPPLLPWRVSLDAGRQPDGNGDASTTAGGSAKNSNTKKRARKGVKNVNLLSFGGDEELAEEEEGLDNDGTGKAKKGKIQSSHDVLAPNSDKGKLRVESGVEDEPERRGSLHQDGDIDVLRRQRKSNEVTNKEQNELPRMSEPTGVKETTGVDGTGIEEALNSKNNKFATQIPKVVEKTTKEPTIPSKIVTERVSSVSQPKKMSLVEARRARYASKIAAVKPKTKTDRQQREMDTMAKFMAFQKKIIQQQAMSGDDKKNKKHQSLQQNDNSKGDNNEDDNHDENHRRDKKKEKKKKPSKHDKESRGLDTTGYHGQVLEQDIDEEGEGNGEWIQTKFKCRRHIDLDARMGGDGRTVDDYEVVEERNSATDRKYDRKKSKHHHH